MKSLKKAKQKSSQWAHLASMMRLTACNAPGAQWGSSAVDWPPAAWTPFCCRTKREFTLFSWICIVLPHDTKVTTQVYRALNNGLIDGTLIIGTGAYLLWPWGGGIEKKPLHISTRGQAQHSVSNRFHLNNSEAVHLGKIKQHYT